MHVLLQGPAGAIINRCYTPDGGNAYGRKLTETWVPMYRPPHPRLSRSTPTPSPSVHNKAASTHDCIVVGCVPFSKGFAHQAAHIGCHKPYNRVLKPHDQSPCCTPLPPAVEPIQVADRNSHIFHGPDNSLCDCQPNRAKLKLDAG